MSKLSRNPYAAICPRSSINDAEYKWKGELGEIRVFKVYTLCAGGLGKYYVIRCYTVPTRLTDHVWSLDEMCATLPAQASATKKIDKGLILKALGEVAG